MDNNVWKRLQKEFTDSPTDMGGSIQDEDIIINAEKILSISFCPSYKKFLKLYGGAIFEGHFVYGLKKQRSMSSNCWSVVDVTNFYKTKQKWPGIDDWYIISDDGRGNPIGINPKGEVYLSDHDSGFEQVKLAESFEEFLHKLLTDTLYE